MISMSRVWDKEKSPRQDSQRLQHADHVIFTFVSLSLKFTIFRFFHHNNNY